VNRKRVTQRSRGFWIARLRAPSLVGLIDCRGGSGLIAQDLFWILPVEVLGSGVNITVLGALKCGRRAWQCSINSVSVACAPGLSST
jgi:hypothetical protein